MCVRHRARARETQSAAGFAPLADILEDAGYRTICLDVPSGAAATAAGYAELLAPQVPADVHQPVVAAHSAAGLLLPALARRLDARHQVWLAAVVADYTGARSLFNEITADPTVIFQPEWVGVDPTTDPVVVHGAHNCYFAHADKVAEVIMKATRP